MSTATMSQGPAETENRDFEIGDLVQHVREQLKIKLRYSPEWTGRMQAVAYVKANVICQIETEVLTDEHHRQPLQRRTIPPGSDQQETNREAVEKLSREVRLAYTELLRRAGPERPVFGRVVSHLMLRCGYITALDIQRVVRLLNQVQPL